MSNKICNMRIDYSGIDLSKKKLNKNPIKQFNIWFKEARKNKISEPNAMILSTINKNNFPSSRTVLLKEINNKGFIFYTNYNSQKAKDIINNPNVSLNFLWKKMERQIIIQGYIKKVSRVKSEEYFKTRSRNSQIAAWASNQSQTISNKKVLDDNYKDMQLRFKMLKNIPKPDYWGGFLIIPKIIEFWQGKKSRLHDRFCYEKKNNAWKIFRLSP